MSIAHKTKTHPLSSNLPRPRHTSLAVRLTQPAMASIATSANNLSITPSWWLAIACTVNPYLVISKPPTAPPWHDNRPEELQAPDLYRLANHYAPLWADPDDDEPYRQYWLDYAALQPHVQSILNLSLYYAIIRYPAHRPLTPTALLDSSRTQARRINATIEAIGQGYLTPVTQPTPEHVAALVAPHRRRRYRSALSSNTPRSSWELNF